MKENGKKNSLPNQSQKSERRRLPAYIEGAASVADLYGTLFIDFMDKFNINDYEALSSDWESVGQDMKNVISQTQIRARNQLKEALESAMDDETVRKALERIFKIALDEAAQENGNEQIKTPA